MATSPKEWKASKQGVDLNVPSGNTCLARRPGMEVFLQRGMIPNSLMPIVRKAMKTGDAPEFNTEDVTEEMLSDIINLVDAVVVYCVQEPVVSPAPSSPREVRSEDVLYVDEIDMDDKMFIFNWAVGGTSDLETFRQQSAASLESIRASADVERAPEQPAGDRG